MRTAMLGAVLLAGCATVHSTDVAAVNARAEADARILGLVPCQELSRASLLTGRLVIAATGCSERACGTRACCNRCEWTAVLQAAGGERTLDPATVTALLGGPPADALDCEVEAWRVAAADAIFGVSGLPLEEGAESAVSRPELFCLEAAAR